MHAASDPVSHPLSGRDVVVLRLVVDGLTNQAIASELHVSTSTVQAHVASGMRKVGARSRTRLAVRALRAGIVPYQQLGSTKHTVIVPYHSDRVATVCASQHVACRAWP